MASLSEAREAVAASLEGIDGLAGSHPRVPGQIHTPCAIVEPGEIDFRTTMQRGHDKVELWVRVLLGTASNEASQLARDSFFDRGGPADVKDAIETGVTAFPVFVTRARKFDAWTFAGVTYLGVEFVVEAYA